MLDPDAFRQVVIGGALMERGMPRFAGFLKPEQADMIRANIRMAQRAAISCGR